MGSLKMASSLVRRVLSSNSYSRQLTCLNNLFHFSTGKLDSSINAPINSGEEAISKFAELVEKVSKQTSTNNEYEEGQVAKTRAEDKTSRETEQVKDEQSFATLFRNSKLVSLGEYQGRFIEGTIIEVMDDDMYIDFGGKFHCVCQRPQWAKNKSMMVRGKKVSLELKALEMSSAFLGSDKHITLLEADAVLRGTISRG